MTKASDHIADTLRDLRLAFVSQEIEHLAKRVAADVSRQRSENLDKPGSSFLIYTLNDQNGAKIESDSLKADGITAEDIAATKGFRAFVEHCERLQLKARVDDRVVFGRGTPESFVGIIVDGWP